MAVSVAHVKRVPRRAAPALDGTTPLLSAAVAVVRGNARQRGGGSAGERSQFGHFGQHR